MRTSIFFIAEPTFVPDTVIDRIGLLVGIDRAACTLLPVRKRATDVDDRRAYWERRVVGLRRFQIISTHLTKSAAQSAENRKTANHGCVSNPGGGGPALGPWRVYHFWYTRDMGP